MCNADPGHRDCRSSFAMPKTEVFSRPQSERMMQMHQLITNGEFPNCGVAYVKLIRRGCINSDLIRDLGYFMSRNEVAILTQDVELARGWSIFALIHPCRVAGAIEKLQPQLSIPMGRLKIPYQSESRHSQLQNRSCNSKQRGMGRSSKHT